MELVPILMVDDDQDDCFLTHEAFEETRLKNPFFCVHDGEEMLDYLHGRDRFADRRTYPMPGLILLDLNMPRMDGRTALQKLEQHPEFKRIPVIILSTSGEEIDISSTYDLGANSFITKPVDFEEMVRTLRVMGEYWFSVVKLP